MRYKIIPLLLMISVLQACEYDIDFKKLGQKPHLCVVGLAGDSDATVIRLLPTKVLGDSQAESLPVEEARISLTVNGEEVELQAAHGLPTGSFYTDYPLEAGDRLELRASVEGVDPVRAQCAVPGEFPEYSVGFEKIRGTWNGDDSNLITTRMNVTVDFKDDPDTDDYYGIQVYRSRERYGYFNVMEYEWLEPVTYSSGIYDFSLSDLPLLMRYAPGADMYAKEAPTMLIVDDGSFVDGKGKMEFLTLYRNDTSDMGYKYKIFLYRISPELYRFVKADAIASAGMPILLMMAPPAYAYTNVLGGVGVFGGVSCTETDWIPNI